MIDLQEQADEVLKVLDDKITSLSPEHWLEVCEAVADGATSRAMKFRGTHDIKD